MESTQVIKIQQFDGTNFANWQYRVGILLDEKGLRKYIEKDLLEHLVGVTVEAMQNTIKTEEKKCVSVLVQTIHDNQLENVVDKKTAKEMFDALCSIYERKSIASQLLLRKKLLMMKYNESDDMLEHFLQFDKIVRELKSTGAKMENLDIVVHLLLTLPRSYNNLVTALETMDQEKLSLEFVKTRLMDEYNKRKDNNPNRSQVSGAMNAKVKQLICYGCGKSGHVKSKCKFKKNGESKKKDVKIGGSANEASNEDQSKESTMCVCTNEVGSIFNDTHKSTHFNTDTQANFTQHGECTSCIRFVDSGATQHMVNDKRFFDELEDIDNVNIFVAKKNESITAK